MAPSDSEPHGSQRLSSPPSSDILAGPLNAPLLRLAVPMMAGFLFQIGFNYADTFYVANLGGDALAAVGSTMFVVWALLSLAEVVTVGTLSRVARAIGARDGKEAGAVGLVGGVGAVGISVVVSLAGLTFVEPLVGLLGLEPEPAALAVDYLSVLLMGYGTLVGFLLLESVFRGAGDTRTPMVVLAGTFVANIVLDRVLIFGLGPIPALGVAGAAWATVSARGVGTLLLGYLLWRRASGLGIRRPDPGWLTGERLGRILRIGIPASAAGLTFCVIYMLLVRITAGFGTAPVGALGLALRLESLAFYVALSLGRAAATMAGQNLGAKQPERAKRAAQRAKWIAFAAMIPVALVMAFLPEPCVELFTDEREVVVAAASYLRIASWVMPIFVVEVVLDNVAAGVGDTVPAMAIEVIGTGLRIPMALGLAALGLDYVAVWWAITLSTVVKAVCFELWFRAGGWLERE